MPDIAKLPELAEIFGVTVDEILGGGNPVVEKVTAGEPVQPADYTREELKEAAEVLRPSQVEKLAGEVREDRESLLTLVPFLDEETVGELATQLAQEGGDVTGLVPFMAEEKVDELALLLEQNGKDTVALAPFMSEEARWAGWRNSVPKTAAPSGSSSPLPGRKSWARWLLPRCSAVRMLRPCCPSWVIRHWGPSPRKSWPAERASPSSFLSWMTAPCGNMSKRRWAVKFAAWRGLSRLTRHLPLLRRKSPQKAYTQPSARIGRAAVPFMGGAVGQ